MKYVFDIDGTLCTNTNGKYSEAMPLEDRIKKVNALYDEGNTITLYTARGMNTYNGNVEAVYEAYFKLTKEQLKSWNVKYDNLILGKPAGDLYIDDKGVSDVAYF